MPRTIQCPHCGVVLNLPDNATGKRLKCPKCANKFDATEADPEHSSTISAHDAGLDSMIGPGQSRFVAAPGQSRVAPTPGQSRVAPAPGQSRVAPTPGQSRVAPAPASDPLLPT